MSDYEEDFEDYDDDDFEDEDEELENEKRQAVQDDDYDVIPTVGPPPPSSYPVTSAMRFSNPGGRPPYPPRSPVRSGGMTSPMPRPMSQQSGSRPISRGLDVPSPMQSLPDSVREAAAKKLAHSLNKMKLVKLTECAQDPLWSAAPLSQYELFQMARSKQYRGLRPGATQTHEDDREEETQTDEVDTKVRSCQVPEDMAAGGIGDDAEGVAGASKGAGSRVQAAAAAAIRQDPYLDSKLNAFTRWAGPQMLAALGDDPSMKRVAIAPSSTDSRPNPLSGGRLQLHCEPLLAQRPVSAAAFCPGPEPLLLISYRPVCAQLGPAALLNDHSVNALGVSCVWDLSVDSGLKAGAGLGKAGAGKAAGLTAVLVSEGSPLCCCWAPAPNTTLVFAGLEEGGVCAWDLEESASQHPVLPEKITGKRTAGRRPSFTTEASWDDAGIAVAAPIVSLASVPKDGFSGFVPSSRPFTLISLTVWGTVTIFSVSMLTLADRQGAAADSDYGLRPGSRVRILKTGCISVRSLINQGPGSMGISLLNPTDKGGKQAATRRSGVEGTNGTAAQANGKWNDGTGAAGLSGLSELTQTHGLAILHGAAGGREFIVCADAGRLIRGSWIGNVTAPRIYIPDSDPKSDAATFSLSLAHPAAATAVAASVFCPQAFVAGYADGSLTLHCVEVAAAMLTWPQAAAAQVTHVQWSPVRPAVFFALDTRCTIYVFDLATNQNGPTAVLSALTQGLKNGGGGAPNSIPTVLEGGVMRTAVRDGCTGGYCIGYDDGLVECHVLQGGNWGPSDSSYLSIAIVEEEDQGDDDAAADVQELVKSRRGKGNREKLSSALTKEIALVENILAAASPSSLAAAAAAAKAKASAAKKKKLVSSAAAG